MVQFSMVLAAELAVSLHLHSVAVVAQCAALGSKFQDKSKQMFIMSV